MEVGGAWGAHNVQIGEVLEDPRTDLLIVATCQNRIETLAAFGERPRTKNRWSSSSVSGLPCLKS